MTSHPGEPNQGSLDRDLSTIRPQTWVPEENSISDRDLSQRSRRLLCTHDLQGRLLSVDSHPARLLGYTPDELLQIPMRDLLGHDFRDQFDAYLREIERVGEAHGVMAVMTRTGERRFWEYHNTLQRDELEKPVVRGIAYDVTGHKRSQSEHRQSDEQFRLFIEHAPAALAMFDREMRYLHVSRRWRTAYGLGDRDLHGISHYDIFPDLPERWKQAYRRGLAGEIVRGDNDHFDRSDGSVQWIRWEVRPWYETSGRIGGIVVFAEDFTERRLAEDELRESEARERARAKELAAILDVLPIPVMIARDPECRFITANREGREHLRLEPDANPSLSAPSGKKPSFRILRDGVEVPAGESPMQWAAATGRAVREMPVTLVFEDGTKRYELSNAAPLLDDDGKVRGAVGASIDVTERIRAAEGLKKSEERLRLAQEAAQIGAFERNLQTGECQWTPQMEALYGLPPGGYPRTIEEFLELVHPDDRVQVASWISQSVASGKAEGEWRVIWPDGTVRWLSGRWRAFTDANGKPERVIGVDFDITDRKRVEEELRQAKEKLAEEKLYLEQEIDTELGFEEIIGQSKALKAVMESVAKVAASDAAVLLLGETGTGKELVARAIHRLSRRAGNAFVKTNCAAIPSGLLESELFGNEKGAFTGAVSKKIGRLELADKGTIFLDEVGEISLALQPKLLRVLQDQEFERLGGTQTLKINFRLIAATNRDLGESVRENEFRSDLYYRLNVFPIVLPPLRERRDDIPLLVEHFVQKIARRMNKLITSIPKKTMDALVGWSWPGNVRELENFLERSVILTAGTVLAAPLGELRSPVTEQVKNETLEAAEREHILRALRQCHGQVSGPRGAATRLGVKRTTLQSKLKRMGISPRVPPPQPL